MLGGKIFDNHAGSNGGGVFFFFKGEFNRLGGEISGNKATCSGNDVYTSYDEGQVVASKVEDGY